MIHAYFEHLTLTGYERYCGWIQFIRNEVSLLDFRLLSETDWNMQKTLISNDTGGEDK